MALPRRKRLNLHAAPDLRSHLRKWETAKTDLRDAEYCRGFLSGAGKVYMNQWSCKIEITAREEFKAALLVLQHLYGGLLRRTEGSQGTKALKWTWLGQNKQAEKCSTTKQEQEEQEEQEEGEEGQKEEGEEAKQEHNSEKDKDLEDLKSRHMCPKPWTRPLVNSHRSTYEISWDFVAGLFDAIGTIKRLQGGNVILEMTHRNFNLLEAVRQFLDPTASEGLVLQDFHRRSRLLIHSKSKAFHLRLLTGLRVKRRVLETLTQGDVSHVSILSLEDLRLIAAAQGAYLESNSQGKLRLIPKSQNFKRHLEFQARQEEATQIRHILELGTFDFKMLQLLEDIAVQASRHRRLRILLGLKKQLCVFSKAKTTVIH
eukprot:Skav220875  [mRNA]  locus=scaffold2625:32490:34334:+ [translate_table: standard]